MVCAIDYEKIRELLLALGEGGILSAFVSLVALPLLPILVKFLLNWVKENWSNGVPRRIQILQTQLDKVLTPLVMAECRHPGYPEKLQAVRERHRSLMDSPHLNYIPVELIGYGNSLDSCFSDYLECLWSFYNLDKKKLGLPYEEKRIQSWIYSRTMKLSNLTMYFLYFTVGILLISTILTRQYPALAAEGSPYLNIAEIAMLALVCLLLLTIVIYLTVLLCYLLSYLGRRSRRSRINKLLQKDGNGG